MLDISHLYLKSEKADGFLILLMILSGDMLQAYLKNVMFTSSVNTKSTQTEGLLA